MGEYQYKVYVWDKKYHEGPAEKLYVDQSSGSYIGDTLNDPAIISVLNGTLIPTGCFFRVYKHSGSEVYQVMVEGETYKTY